MKDITPADKKLVNEARRVAKRFSLVKWKGQSLSCVGAALRTKSGKIYSGPNIEHPDSGPSSICAEYSALAKAFSEGHKEVALIVAYYYGGKGNHRVLSPCGRCREFLRLFGNPEVIINISGDLKKIRLDVLHPFSKNW